MCGSKTYCYFIKLLLGIILLEEMLHGGGEELEERPTKRARYGTQSAATAVSKDTTMWIELAR